MTNAEVAEAISVLIINALDAQYQSLMVNEETIYKLAAEATAGNRKNGMVSAICALCENFYAIGFSKAQEMRAIEMWPCEEAVDLGIEAYGRRLDVSFEPRMVGMAPGFRAGVEWARLQMVGSVEEP